MRCATRLDPVVQTFQKTTRQNIARTAADIHKVLNMTIPLFFKCDSVLGLYREATLVPERIPDEDLPMFSSLWTIRLSQTKDTVHPQTGKRVLWTFLVAFKRYCQNPV
jgi:hypothetical protein